MFTVVVDRRTRSVWSARTVAISAGAHLLVLGAVVTAVANTRPADPPPEVVDIWSAPDRPPTPAVTPPPATDRPLVKGDFVAVHPPKATPRDVPPPDLDRTPFDPDDFNGLGREGDVVRLLPVAVPRPPAADPEPPLHDWRTDDPIDARDAEQLPQLLSPRDAQRMLERVYPGRLRDTGVTGHTTVVLVIDKTGAVEPGSVTVQETTHDAFREAAVRAAEHFRFSPARLHGEPVSVVISLPIDWQIRP